MSKKTHYTAHIKVDRVEKTMLTTKVYNERTRASEEAEAAVGRNVLTIANLSFTAADTDELSEKIAAHIALITDGELE